MINKNFYREFVEGYCKRLQQIPDYQPESGIFIPYTFNNYTKAEKKIFFSVSILPVGLKHRRC